MQRIIIGLGLALIIIGFGLFAWWLFDGEEDTSADEAEIRVAVGALRTAAADNDWDAWIALFSDGGRAEALTSLGAGTLDAARAEWESIETSAEGIGIENIDVDGNVAAATLTSALVFPGQADGARLMYAERAVLSKIDGSWKFDRFVFTAPAIPDDTITVAVEAEEYAFSLDANKLEDGRLAFSLDNAGEQAHQLSLQRVPATLDIEAWIRFSGYASPADDIGNLGGTTPVQPGDSLTVPFTEPLDAGRYVLMCFMRVQDGAEGELHVNRGMYAEFTIE